MHSIHGPSSVVFSSGETEDLLNENRCHGVGGKACLCRPTDYDITVSMGASGWFEHTIANRSRPIERTDYINYIIKSAMLGHLSCLIICCPNPEWIALTVLVHLRVNRGTLETGNNDAPSFLCIRNTLTHSETLNQSCDNLSMPCVQTLNTPG